MADDRQTDLSRTWDLCAPSSQVLLTGAATPNSWAVSLAFKELVLRGNLLLGTEQQRRFLVLHRTVSMLSVGRWPAPGTERSLVGVMEAFPKAAIFQSGGGSVPIAVAAREVQRWYRAGGGYVQAEVLPELRRRGCYRLVDTERGPEWQLTDAGERKLEALRGLMETGRTRFPHWVQQDQDQARDYVQTAGPALLLVGNPAFWLWGALGNALAGEAMAADAIPAHAGLPFPRLTERDPSGSGWLSGGIEFGGHGQGEPVQGDASAGGGGGFESPGETIDAAIDGDGDGDGGGDGE